MFRNVVTAVFVLLAGAQMSFALNPQTETEILVKMKTNQSNRQGRLKLGRFKTIALKKNEKMADALRKLNMDPNVEYAEPNYILSIPEKTKPQLMDPKFSLQWGLDNTGSNDPADPNRQGVAGADIDAIRAWEINKGSKEIRIAVIDTGVDYKHEDLQDNILINEVEKNGQPGVDDDGNGYIDDIYGYDFANNDGDPMDDNDHGTHCAGIIGAVHNNLGISGVMAKVSILPIKYLDHDGSGATDIAIKAIKYAIARKVNIISASWGSFKYSQALREAIEEAGQNGIIFVAASGNNSVSNDRYFNYPSSYNLPNVVAVGSHDFEDKLSSFSNIGKRTVHIVAPGSNIISTIPGNQYGVASGTSMATPHVAGVLGLLLSQNQNLTPEQARAKLMKSSVPGVVYLRTVSGGRINAYNLLTDIYPPRRFQPDASLWKKVTLERSFESPHPSIPGFSYERKLSIPGAKYIRIIFNKFEIASYATLGIYSTSGELVDWIDWKDPFKDLIQTTEYVEGDTVIFKYDSSRFDAWGFRINDVEVIY